MADQLSFAKPAETPYDLGPLYKHTGRVEVHEIYRALDTETCILNVLFFDAGQRSRPHTHDADQIIYFLDGPGVVAFDGGQDRLVQPGVFVMLPAGIAHMHGAPDANAATHISIMPPGHVNDFDCPIPEQWRRFRENGRPAPDSEGQG
jgi:quercetin dioxygenase-like cupin family protein